MTRNERVRFALKEKNIPQKKIAELIDVRSATISDNLNSDQDVDSIKLINAVVETTGFSKIWLIDGIGEKYDSIESLKTSLDMVNDMYRAKEEENEYFRRSLKMAYHQIDRQEAEIASLKKLIKDIGGEVPPEFIPDL